jgi:hypothetical protein
MSVIKVSCPDCGKEIQINVKTIDTLKKDLESMTKDRDWYKNKLTALELMNKAKPKNPFGDIFGF